MSVQLVVEGGRALGYKFQRIKVWDKANSISYICNHSVHLQMDIALIFSLKASTDFLSRDLSFVIFVVNDISDAS